MDINQKDINNMLGDIDKLKNCLDYNRDIGIFIKKFKNDLNILFEMVKDDEGDFRRNLVVLLLDIVDQINIYEFNVEKLDVIKDMTRSLLGKVTGEKLDYYISLTIEKNIYVVRTRRI